MYCKKCGGENAEGATTCYYCGCVLGQEAPPDNDCGYVVINSHSNSSSAGGSRSNNAKTNATTLTAKEEKNIKTLGFFLGFLLSFIGLIIGICIYPPESRKRRAFLTGWAIGFIVEAALGVIAGIIYGIVIGIMLLVVA